MPGANRQTVDLSGFPDLVVIYLGMRVNRPRGLRTLAWIGPQIKRSVLERPDGLLLHEDLIFSMFPPHLGMRQYWRDFDAMERWARSLPHKQWWQRFVRDTGGTGFWHETYLMRGGMEATGSATWSWSPSPTAGLAAGAAILGRRTAAYRRSPHEPDPSPINLAWCRWFPALRWPRGQRMLTEGWGRAARCGGPAPRRARGARRVGGPRRAARATAPQPPRLRGNGDGTSPGATHTRPAARHVPREGAGGIRAAQLSAGLRVRCAPLRVVVAPAVAHPGAMG